MGLPDDNGGFVDVLRLSEQAHQSLLNELDRGERDVAGHEKRRSKRLAYRDVQGVILQVTHPGGTTARYMVKPRNLSQSGLSVLHGGFMHPGTQCVAPLRDLNHEPHSVRGHVVTCRHIRGRIHEVGIEFERPIAIQDYVLGADGFDEDDGCGGPVRLPSLSGRVLVVDEWEEDRHLLSYDLQKLGVDVVEATSGVEVLRRIARACPGHYNIVLTGEWLGDSSGAVLAERLRNRGCRAPVIGLFMNVGDMDGTRIRESGLAAVVEKPCSVERLSQLLMQFLMLDPTEEVSSQSGPCLSSRWDEVGMRPMILSFLQALELRLGELEQQLRREESDPLRMCQQLKGVAAGYGFPQLSSAADKLIGLLEHDAPMQDLQASLDELSGLASASLDATRSAAV